MKNEFSSQTIADIREKYGVSERTAFRYKRGHSTPHKSRGRPRAVLPANLVIVYKARQDAGETSAEIADSFSVSRGTLFNRLREYATQGDPK